MSNKDTKHVVAADKLDTQAQSVETLHTDTLDNSLYRDAVAEKLPVNAEQEDSSPRTVTGWSWFLFLGSIYFVALLYGLDTTIVANIQGSLVEQFGEVEKLSWVGAGFPLGSVAVILSLGKAFGIFENKWLFILSIFIFNVGSAVCGSAPSMNALIIGRVIAGIGGAGDYLGCLNIITRFTTLRERPLYVSLIGLHWGIGLWTTAQT